MKISRGFTLIEVMIVVVVIGLLAAIAIPSYTSYVIKSRRSSAQSALLDLASREERYFATNNVYTTSLPLLGYPTGTVSLAIPDSNSHYYDIAAPVVAGNGYTLKATPAGTQVNDTQCSVFTYTSLGVRGNETSGGTSLNSCWN